MIKVGFKFSTFGILTEIKQDVSIKFFGTSKTTEIVLKLSGNLMGKLSSAFATSILFDSIKDLKYNFFSKPLKLSGLIVITTIAMNLILTIILQKQIALWSWIVRELFLFVGISGLFCNVDWQDLKKTSFILRKA